MDLGKDPSRLALQNTPAPQQEQNHVPEFIGRWNLRNREQLRKRKAEAQEQQTSQLQLRGQKKCKRQKTGKENERRGRKKQNAEPKVVPESPLKEKAEKAAACTQGETESPMDVAETPVPVAPPPEAVPEKHLTEVGQKSITHQEDSSENREIVVQNQPSEICQEMAEPEDLAPKMCQEIPVPQDPPFKMCHGTAETEDLSPQTSQDVDIPKAPLPETSKDVQDVERCVETCPDIDVSEGCHPDLQQERVEPEEWNVEPDQELAETGTYFPNTQLEIAVPNDLSRKEYSEPDLPECSSHKMYQETAGPQSLSDRTNQETSKTEEYPLEIDEETPGPEDCALEMYQETPRSEVCAPEMYQETPGPENCASEMYQETPGLEVCAPEMYQEAPGPVVCVPEMYRETSGPEICAPEMYQETSRPEYGSPELYQETPGPEDLSTKAYTHQDVPTGRFPEANQETEIKEKPKAEDSETSASPNVPQESHPEQDIFSYVLF
ncbi:hemogen [Sorex araneus]|uniref:hemogen n=1 Tax=Sorex araneus TaxID=42254 RepID=UPI0024336005|nr:hemogen [Sorex araneus]